MPRVIRIKMCYNCPYRSSIIFEGSAVWFCNHYKINGLEIGDVMAEPPKFCPLEKEGERGYEIC